MTRTLASSGWPPPGVQPGRPCTAWGESLPSLAPGTVPGTPQAPNPWETESTVLRHRQLRITRPNISPASRLQAALDIVAIGHVLSGTVVNPATDDRRVAFNSPASRTFRELSYSTACRSPKLRDRRLAPPSNVVRCTKERTVRAVDQSMPPQLVLEMPKDQPACRPPHEGDVHMPSETAPIQAA